MGKWPKNSEELKYFVLNSFGFHFLCAHKRECENVQDSSVIKCTSIASILVKVWQSNLPFQQTICTVELASYVSQRWSLGLGCNFDFSKGFCIIRFLSLQEKIVTFPLLYSWTEPGIFEKVFLWTWKNFDSLPQLWNLILLTCCWQKQRSLCDIIYLHWSSGCRI